MGSCCPSLPKRVSNNRIRASLFSLELKRIDQVLFDPHIPGQQVRHEKLGQCGFIVEHPDHCVFLKPKDGALGHRGRRGHAKRLSLEAPFTKEIAAPQDRDDRFLPACGDYGQLHLALLDIKTASAGPPCEKTVVSSDIPWWFPRGLSPDTS
jgi:hypothetical protein